jgi:hypothetical protein
MILGEAIGTSLRHGETLTAAATTLLRRYCNTTQSSALLQHH